MTVQSKEMEPRFTVLSFYEAYPPESGAASVTYNTARFLPGFKTLIQLGPKEDSRRLSDNLDLITIASESKHRLKKALALQNKFKKATEAVKKSNPDAVVLEGASWAPYYVLQLRDMKRAGLAPRVIYHAHNVEYLLRRDRGDRLIARLTRWGEGKLMREADLATAVSEADAAQFRRLYGVNPVLFPNGVDTAAFDSVGAGDVARIRDKYRLSGFTVLFMGLITYPPTREGLRFLMEEVFPTLAQTRRDVKLVVIGGDLGESRPWLINPGLIPFQEVPALIKACSLCAAPIFTGSGTRVKILEYLAAGRPVVSTAKGAEGLDAETGRHLLLADGAEEFRRSILRIHGDGDLAAGLGSRGRELVEYRYAWPVLIRSFFPAVRAMLRGNKDTGGIPDGAETEERTP